MLSAAPYTMDNKAEAKYLRKCLGMQTMNYDDAKAEIIPKPKVVSLKQDK